MEVRHIRTEIHILTSINEFLTELMVPFECQNNIKNHRIQLYLPEQKLAIDIDERNHADRDVQYEQTTAPVIIKYVGCKLPRINPDQEGFGVSSYLGPITNELLRFKRDIILLEISTMTWTDNHIGIVYIIWYV